MWGIQAGWGTLPHSWWSAPADLADGQYVAEVSVNQRYRELFRIPADQASASRPTGAAKIPKGPKPDLRALPAFGIGILGAEEPGGREYLAFGANVWNAGPSPLVVDDFRRAGEDVMDAYQYFYDSKGNQVG